MSRRGFLKIIWRVFQCLTFPIRIRRSPTFQCPHSLTGRRLFPRRSPTQRKSRICCHLEPSEPPGDDVPKVGQQPRQQRDLQTC